MVSFWKTLFQRTCDKIDYIVWLINTSFIGTKCNYFSSKLGSPHIHRSTPLSSLVVKTTILKAYVQPFRSLNWNRTTINPRVVASVSVCRSKRARKQFGRCTVVVRVGASIRRRSTLSNRIFSLFECVCVYGTINATGLTYTDMNGRRTGGGVFARFVQHFFCGLLSNSY